MGTDLHGLNPCCIRRRAFFLLLYRQLFRAGTFFRFDELCQLFLFSLADFSANNERDSREKHIL